MWCNSKSFMLLLTTLLFTLQKVSGAAEYSNSTALSVVPDDDFYGMPVYYKSNTPIKQFLSKEQMSKHIQEILEPLSPFIVSDDRRVAIRNRRQDGGAFALGAPCHHQKSFKSKNINSHSSPPLKLETIHSG